MYNWHSWSPTTIWSYARGWEKIASDGDAKGPLAWYSISDYLVMGVALHDAGCYHVCFIVFRFDQQSCQGEPASSDVGNIIVLGTFYGKIEKRFFALIFQYANIKDSIMSRVLIFRYKMVVLFNWDLRNINEEFIYPWIESSPQELCLYLLGRCLHRKCSQPRSYRYLETVVEINKPCRIQVSTTDGRMWWLLMLPLLQLELLPRPLGHRCSRCCRSWRWP